MSATPPMRRLPYSASAVLSPLCFTAPLSRPLPRLYLPAVHPPPTPLLPPHLHHHDHTRIPRAQWVEGGAAGALPATLDAGAIRLAAKGAPQQPTIRGDLQSWLRRGRGMGERGGGRRFLYGVAAHRAQQTPAGKSDILCMEVGKREGEEESAGEGEGRKGNRCEA